MIHPAELLRHGGSWLAAARSWMQWHRNNGATVTWGSDQVLQPPLTVKEVEEMAADVAAETMRKLHERMLGVWQRCGYTESHESPDHDYVLLINPKTLAKVRVYADGAVFPAGAEADGLLVYTSSKEG